MNDERIPLKRFLSLFGEKKGLWAAAATLLIGILLLVFGGSGKEVKTGSSWLEADTKALEDRVKQLCERVIGVGDAEVMITMDTVSEQMYAKNSQITSDGSRNETRVEYVTASGDLVPVGEELAHVRGIAVVCKGGDDPGVKLALVNMLTALFEIPSNAVSIVEGK